MNESQAERLLELLDDIASSLTSISQSLRHENADVGVADILHEMVLQLESARIYGVG